MPPSAPPGPAAESLSRPDIFTVIVGTAGHIDHGKSTLVKRLTGIDPDRLPEEKSREMTIDLGFAPLRLPGGKTVGMIDVPGHERFVKNMVAGATGIDVALLVVDANEGVMPQTREHVEIMTLLGIRTGLIALTKVDTAGADLAALAADDVRSYLAGTFLERAPVIPVSSLTGEGIERLLAEIEAVCRRLGPRKAAGPFRMPIQRVFSAHGFGTIVTGVPVSGIVRAGDHVEVLPLGKGGKVRGIEAYRAEALEARAGHSTALNVSDLDYKEVARGMVVAAPGCFEGATLVDARLRYLRSARRRLKHLSTVKLHAGTAEVTGEVALLEGKDVAPGAETFVQLRLHEPAVVAPGDRFILRLHSPAVTIGGGVVLGTSRHRLKAGKPFVIEALAAKEKALGDPVRYVEETLRAARAGPVAAARLRVEAALDAAGLDRALAALTKDGRAVALHRGARYVHRDGLEAARAAVQAALEGLYAKQPLRLFVERLELKTEAALPDDELFDAALESLAKERKVERLAEGDRVRKPGRTASLTPEQEKLRARLHDLYREARFQTPSPDEAAAKLDLPAKRVAEVKKVLALLGEEGLVLEVAPGILFAREALEEAKAALFDEFRKGGAFSASAYRERLGTTRKYVIPLLEHFDALGLTVRRGADRFLKVPLP